MDTLVSACYYLIDIGGWWWVFHHLSYFSSLFSSGLVMEQNTMYFETCGRCNCCDSRALERMRQKKFIRLGKKGGMRIFRPPASFPASPGSTLVWKALSTTTNGMLLKIYNLRNFTIKIHTLFSQCVAAGAKGNIVYGIVPYHTIHTEYKRYNFLFYYFLFPTK